MRTFDLDSANKDPAVLMLYNRYIKLKKVGKEYVGLCVFHKEKTPSFKVYQSDGAYIWHCFGCHKTGNITQLVEQIDKITEKQAINKIKEFFTGRASNVERSKEVDKTFHRVGEEKNKVTIAYEKYEVCERLLEKSKPAIEYLKSRGITLETAKKLRIGFRQDIGSLAGSNKDLSDKGWLTLPCIEGDEVVCLKYRSIVRKVFCRQPNMKTALFNTETIDPVESVHLVEGEMDTAIMEQAGFYAVGIPSAGIALTPEMKDKLLEADRIILAGDTDAAGSEAMTKLWAELQPKAVYLRWPEGLKDANDVFLNKSKKDIKAFQMLVGELTTAASSNPMPGIYSLPEAMQASKQTNLADHPNRLPFPWPSVDKMAVILPGSVTGVSASSTGVGKTQWVMNATIYAARKKSEVILNYQCELSVDEYSNIVAAHLLGKDRNHLTSDDYKEASNMLSTVQYYIGRDPNKTTVTPVLDLIEAAIQRFGATTVVLDHIHFICRNEQNEVQAQANAMQRIKNLAVKYNTKFIVVSQPRKPSQQSRNKSLYLSDVKGSETLVSDADTVLFLEREAIQVKDPANPPEDTFKPETKVHLMKARSKGDGRSLAMLTFLGKQASFVEITNLQPPPNLAGQKQQTVV